MKRPLLFLVLVLSAAACETDSGPTSPGPVFRPTTPTTTTPARLTAAQCDPTDVSRSWHGWNAPGARPTVLYNLRFEKREHPDCVDLDIYVRLIVTQGGNAYRKENRISLWVGNGRGGEAGDTCLGNCRVFVPTRDAYRIGYRWQASFRENDWPAWPDLN